MAGGGSYFVCMISHVSHLRLIHSLLIIILLLPPLCALRNLLRTRLLFAVLSVDCYCTYLRYFHSITVSCPSGLCLSASLPMVTSQARLESDVLDPQPGVTAGTRRMFKLWVVRTGLLRSLMSSLSRLVVGFQLHFLGSQALRPLFYLDSC